MKKALYLLGGMLIGACVGAFLYKINADEELSEMEEELNRAEENNRKMKKDLKKTEDENNCKKCFMKRFYDRNAVEDDPKKEESEEAIKRNYASYYKTETEEDDLFEEENENDKSSLEYQEFHNSMMEEPPKLISFEDYVHLPYKMFLEEACMTYYTYDCVLLDEGEEVIEDEEKYVGDILMTYDFETQPTNTLYVLNYQLDTVYEITVVYDSYMDQN